MRGSDCIFCIYQVSLSHTVGEQHIACEKASCIMQNVLAAFSQNALYAARPPWDPPSPYDFSYTARKEGGSEAIMIINAASPRIGVGE